MWIDHTICFLCCMNKISFYNKQNTFQKNEILRLCFSLCPHEYQNIAFMCVRNIRATLISLQKLFSGNSRATLKMILYWNRSSSYVSTTQRCKQHPTIFCVCYRPNICVKFDINDTLQTGISDRTSFLSSNISFGKKKYRKEILTILRIFDCNKNIVYVI